MSFSSEPDFGDIKVVRNGSRPATATLDAPVATVERVSAPVIAPESSAPRKSAVARFWWLPLLLVAGIAAGVWGHNYYNARYVGHDFWAQVPATQDVTPVERFSDSGEATGMYGVDYVLTAFNEAGDQRTLDFVSYGENSADMPQPGAFVWLSASDQIVVRQHVVPESEVPAAVREMIASHAGN